MRDSGRGYARKRSLAGFISQSNLGDFYRNVCASLPGKIASYIKVRSVRR